MQVNLNGKVAIITGGSRGIGRAISLAYGANGARVVIAARDANVGGAVVKEITDKGGQAVFEPTDILEYEAVEKMVQRVIDRFGQVDILVGSGGIGSPSPKLFHQTPPAELMMQFQTRTLVRLYCARAVVNHMISRHFGKIIFVTTDGGRSPTPAETLNGAAAAAVIFWTRSAARELARHGIRVNCISATLTSETPAFERYKKATAQGVGSTIYSDYKKIESRAPWRLNTPADLASVALFLAAEESDQISGTTISVNGGLSFPG